MIFVYLAIAFVVGFVFATALANANSGPRF